jgi:hypothetical protein
MSIPLPPRRSRLVDPVLWIAVALALGLIAALASGSLNAEESWLMQLRQQARAEQGCDLTFIVSERQLPLGNDIRHEGRLRCNDGREFDFTRDRVHQKFTLKLCQPSYC